MAHAISESGYIGTDGKMRMPMDRLRQFSEANKGKRIVARFEAVEPGTSECQLAYYYNYVIPTIRQALAETGERKTEKQVDKWLVEEYPGNKVEREFGASVDDARGFDKEQMSDYLEWLKQFAAENLYVYIDDPKVI